MCIQGWVNYSDGVIIITGIGLRYPHLSKYLKRLNGISNDCSDWNSKRIQSANENYRVRLPIGPRAFHWQPDSELPLEGHLLGICSKLVSVFGKMELLISTSRWNASTSVKINTDVFKHNLSLVDYTFTTFAEKTVTHISHFASIRLISSISFVNLCIGKNKLNEL